MERCHLVPEDAMFVSIGTLFTIAVMGVAIYIILRLGKVRHLYVNYNHSEHIGHFLLKIVIFGCNTLGTLLSFFEKKMSSGVVNQW